MRVQRRLVSFHERDCKVEAFHTALLVGRNSALRPHLEPMVKGF